MIVTFALLFGVFASIGRGEGDATVLLAIAMFITAALAHLWVAVSIRCPRCERRVGWIALVGSGQRWLAQLWRGESCPACGDPGPAPRT